MILNKITTIRFDTRYFTVAVILFLIEVAIALFLHDKFIRPYLGDVLVVMLIYAFLKSFVNLSVGIACTIVLIFAYLIEFLQYLDFVRVIGLEHSRIASTILGNSFSWGDILAYTVGVLLIFAVEKSFNK